jgi:hypothetical protein
MRTFHILVAMSFLIYGVWLIVRPIQAMTHFVGKHNEQAQEMLTHPKFPLIARIIGMLFITLAVALILPSD